MLLVTNTYIARLAKLFCTVLFLQLLPNYYTVAGKLSSTLQAYESNPVF